MQNPSHHQTNKSQLADDAGQWAVSKNIDLTEEYLQRALDKLARWCAKWRIKLNPGKTKAIIFSKSPTAIRAEPAFPLYRDILLYYPHIKFLGITFDNGMTFMRHFEEILERCKQKFHRLRAFVGVEIADLTFRTKQYSTSYSSHICYGKRFYKDFFLSHNTIALVRNCLKLLSCVVIETASDGMKRNQLS